MDLRLGGKRALVTAASHGLGRASAVSLAREGARVAVASRNASSLRDLASAMGGHGGADVLPLVMDLTDAASIVRAVDDVHARWGGIDILVANTPGPPSGSFLSIEPDTWRAALDVTVMAVVQLLRAVLPGMRSNGGGRIIFITTVGTKMVQPDMVLSNATRLAIQGIAKTLSVELAEDGIRANALCPGPIATDRMEELIEATRRERGIDRAAAEAVWLDEVPLGRMGRPGDFGDLVAVLASDVAEYVTGAAIAVDGGKSRAY
jgi:3-oxoacyl-[acyl-carrier protein] reductase